MRTTSPHSSFPSPTGKVLSNTLPKVIRVGEALRWAIERLEATGFVLKPRRHAELLLEKAWGCSRVEIYLNLRQILDLSTWRRFQRLVRRRVRGEPVQYIVGWAPFYGLKLAMRRGVFIPRFDSEALVERAISILREKLKPLSNGRCWGRVLEMCSGCGAMGLAIASELPEVRVLLTDKDPTALKIARTNTRALGLEGRVMIGEWDALSDPPPSWRGHFHLIIANPPYIPLDRLATLHPDVRDWEPYYALTDGSDGLTFYRRWTATVPPLLKPNGVFIVEVGEPIAQEALNILHKGFISIQPIYDLSGNLRGWECGV